jgi:transposase, IS30 family
MLHREGLGVRAIAALLGRALSTVSRELRRNMGAHDNGRYDGDLAQARARERARRCCAVA